MSLECSLQDDSYYHRLKPRDARLWERESFFAFASCFSRASTIEWKKMHARRWLICVGWRFLRPGSTIPITMVFNSRSHLCLLMPKPQVYIYKTPRLHNVPMLVSLSQAATSHRLVLPLNCSALSVGWSVGRSAQQASRETFLCRISIAPYSMSATREQHTLASKQTRSRDTNETASTDLPVSTWPRQAISGRL